MTKSQIEYILSVAQLKNFGKAADACFITQSTLSAMVAKFEEQIGIIIFNRKTRPVSITKEGEKVIKSLKNIYREFHLLDETINDIKGQELGNLSIACIPTVASYLYPMILNQLSDAYPKVNFSIHEFTTENIIENIFEGSLDIGILSTPIENKNLLEYDLYNEKFLLYDCNNQSKKTHYSVADIDLNRLWLMKEGHCLRNQVGKICQLKQEQKIKGNITYNCGSISTLIKMVELNKGVTLLPYLATANNHQIEEQSIFNLIEPIPSRKIGIITHKNFIKKRLLKNIISIIMQSVNQYLPQQENKISIIKPF